MKEDIQKSQRIGVHGRTALEQRQLQWRGFIQTFRLLTLGLRRIIWHRQQIEPACFGSSGFSRLCADRNGMQGDDIDRITMSPLYQTGDTGSDFSLTTGEDNTVIPQPVP
jgi:hypothetical protein